MSNFLKLATIALMVFFSATARADLLTATNVNSADANDVYQVSLSNLGNGALVNIDRTHMFTNLPTVMQGLDYVITANDDKGAAVGFSLNLTYDAGTTLLLSIDGRVGDEQGNNAPTFGGGVMDWVVNDGWEFTGLTWNKSNETAGLTDFFVYSLTPAATSYTFFEQDNGGDRNMYSVAGLAGPLFTGPELAIDRETGSLTLSTDTDTDFLGYSITSAAGTLNQSGWTPIAGNFDAPPSGDGSVDGDDTWTILTAGGVRTDLSEGLIPSGSGDGDGATLSPSSPLVLSSGGAWTKFHDEEVSMTLLLADGTVANVPVTFEGNGGDAFALGDFNTDGAIDVLDYNIFAAGLHTDLSELSLLDAYAMGDINGDGVSTVADFIGFRDAFNVAQGPGAFAALTTAVPEPSTMLLLLAGGVMVASKAGTKRERERSHRKGSYSQLSVAVLLITACLVGLRADSCCAQLLTVTNNNSLDSADVYALSSNWADGELVNVDRTHVFADVPTPFLGLDYVLTANDDKRAGVDFSIDLSFESGTTLLLSIDGRVGDENGNNAPTLGSGVMDWVLEDGWEPTGFSWNKFEQASNFFVYSLDPAGTSYTFQEQNDGGARDMYSIAGGLISDLSPTLRVNTDTGHLILFNGMSTPLDLDYYEITSDSDSLSLNNWNSLDSQDSNNGSGTWTEAGGVDESILSEFRTASDTLAPNDTRDLGFAFNTSGTQDLVFQYTSSGGTSLLAGLVESVTGGPNADFDSDGDIDGADFLTWQRGFGVAGGLANGDATGDGNVNAADLAIWEGQYGIGTAALSAAVTVPEPTSALLVLLAIVGMVGLLRNRNIGLPRRTVNTATGIYKAASRTKGKLNMNATFRSTDFRNPEKSLGLVAQGVAALLVIGVLASSTTFAAVTNDRVYSFGEDNLETGSQGATIGSNSVASNTTVDAIGPSQAYLDLVQTGGASYQDVGPAGLARPGAAAGDFGVRFDGIDDRLEGIALNRPDELDSLTNTTYPLNYTGITGRGLQTWVYPSQAGLNAGTFQSIVFDTIFSGGPAINELGQWTQINSSHSDGGSGETTVPATVDVAGGDTWYHVMHHNYDALASTGPSVIAGSGGLNPFTSILYVNGVAVSANNDNINTGGNPSGDYLGLLVVGAAEIDTDNSGTIEGIGDFFEGVVDDLEMYVYGDNETGQSGNLSDGEDWGTFDLFADNAWIAEEILNTIPGQILAPGDVNKDGQVSQADVAPFIAGWLSENRLTGAHNTIRVGDWSTWDNGDMNHDGITDLADLFILHNGLLAAGAGGVDFALFSGTTVPEPTSLLLLSFACVGLLLRRP